MGSRRVRPRGYEYGSRFLIALQNIKISYFIFIDKEPLFFFDIPSIKLQSALALLSLDIQNLQLQPSWLFSKLNISQFCSNSPTTAPPCQWSLYLKISEVTTDKTTSTLALFIEHNQMLQHRPRWWISTLLLITYVFTFSHLFLFLYNHTSDGYKLHCSHLTKFQDVQRYINKTYNSRRKYY